MLMIGIMAFIHILHTGPAIWISLTTWKRLKLQITRVNQVPAKDTGGTQVHIVACNTSGKEVCQLAMVVREVLMLLTA